MPHNCPYNPADAAARRYLKAQMNEMTGSSELTAVADETLAALQRAVMAMETSHPVYVRIATALSDHITQGGLKHRERLPSHRLLAQALGVNLTTITKSFKYLKERGLVSANAGQGTVVRGRELDHIAPTYERLQSLPRIDLSVLKHPGDAFRNFTADALRQMAGDDACLRLMTEYRPAAGALASRETGVRWLADTGVQADVQDVAVTSGAQHALFVTLAATMKTGDIVLVPSLAYQGIKTAARLLGLGLIPIDVDDGGLLPEALERHVRNPRVKSIYLMPTLDNPGSVTLSLARREAIAQTAAKHGLMVIEDEVHRPLATTPLPSIRELYPERTFYLSSVAKVIAPGLRCGFLLYPRSFGAEVLRALRGTVWMSDPMSLQLTHLLLASGSHRSMIDACRRRLQTRHASACELLGPWMARAGEAEGSCLWVDLPDTLPSDAFADYLRGEGIGVAPSSIFETGPRRHNGMRLYKGSVQRDEDWTFALRTIRAGIEYPPQQKEMA